jgi:hypothetical protein
LTVQERCSGCGAAIAADAASCSYCGAATATPQPVAAPPAPTAAETRADRFRRLRERPNFERLRSHRPTTSGPAGRLIVQSVFGLVFAAFAAVFISFARSGTSGFGGRSGFDVMFTLVPGVLALVGIGIFASAVFKWRRFANAPLVAVPAIVSAKRTKIVGSKDNTRTEYFVSIEPERGARREYEVAGEVFGVVGEGDIGVAYVRDAYLLEFRAVDA